MTYFCLVGLSRAISTSARLSSKRLASCTNNKEVHLCTVGTGQENLCRYSFRLSAPRHNANLSTWQATAFGKRTLRCRFSMCYDIIYDFRYDIRYDILLYAGMCCVTGAHLNIQKQVESFNVKINFDLQEGVLVWYVRHQHFLNSTLCCIGAKWHCYSACHKEFSLMYLSTFEAEFWAHQSDSRQHHASCWSAHALWLCQQPAPALPLHLPCRKCPLIQYFIESNSHPTIPHSFRDDCHLGSASADTQRDRGSCIEQALRGEHQDVVLQQGQPQDSVHPRLFQVAEAERIKLECSRESRTSPTRAGEEATRWGSCCCWRWPRCLRRISFFNII